MQPTQLSNYSAKHFLWEASEGVARITLNRPERKNPLTFESYAELRDLFRALVYADDIFCVVQVVQNLEKRQHNINDRLLF